MIKIRLICSAGMSTSLVVQKMITAAEGKKIEVDIKAMSESAFDSLKEDVDLLLLGPQIGYLEPQIQERYKDKAWPIAVIDMVDYGMLNGEKILNDGLKIMEEN
ncbi:hypothetical protein A5868_001358 [Enterococcus sp. 12F9_DIV0723]|uniref:PTS sugar transporter subunit IIB n=1 Tax=Enterococcus sp. 12F9_DIV0723 TaxID=1834169 RepID=UPI000B3EC8C2|nr:PTS sugar transporter subunit IIB [Enterococcus sp. 12F9_DIV0723]OUZ16437.1 hypothetical protein A5868_001358 [Enterococcus sp. 12F9_DIV0723]